MFEIGYNLHKYLDVFVHTCTQMIFLWKKRGKKILLMKFFFNMHEKLIKLFCYRNKIRRSMNMAKNATRSKATECLLNFEAVKVFSPYLSDK